MVMKSITPIDRHVLRNQSPFLVLGYVHNGSMVPLNFSCYCSSIKVYRPCYKIIKSGICLHTTPLHLSTYFSAKSSVTERQTGPKAVTKGIMSCLHWIALFFVCFLLGVSMRRKQAKHQCPPGAKLMKWNSHQ